jgi:hypothetical protein
MVKFSARGSGRRSLVWSAAGILAGLAVAVPLLTLAGAAGAGKHRIAAADQFLKATYFPIKLRAPGDPQEVRYDISCLPPDGNAEGTGVCDGGGTVYFRSSANVSASVPLKLDSNVQVGRYVAAVPASIWNAPWFTYYAIIRDNTTGRMIVVPQGGSAAPQLSFSMSGSTLDLGVHVFGSTRPAAARVASAGWGSGDGQVGLEDGIDMPAGGASFDVDPAGNVYLLDEANSRLLKFAGGAASTPVPLPGLARVRGDLRVGDASGTAYVLEMPNAAQPKPLLRAYTLQGGFLGSSVVADAAATQIRLSGGTAYVSEYPSSMWAPVLQSNGRATVEQSAQLTRAFAGAPAPDGNVAVLSMGNEIRIGTYGQRGTTYQLSSFRIVSRTPVADVQVAQTLPNGKLVVVFSVYTDTAHEYEVAVIDPSGTLVDQFALPAFEWAQSMPLSRFRLVGSSLYELGSTGAGVFVDRYDLGVS